jgi:hypothetical protein
MHHQEEPTALISLPSPPCYPTTGKDLKRTPTKVSLQSISALFEQEELMKNIQPHRAHPFLHVRDYCVHKESVIRKNEYEARLLCTRAAKFS